MLSKFWGYNSTMLCIGRVPWQLFTTDIGFVVFVVGAGLNARTWHKEIPTRDMSKMIQIIRQPCALQMKDDAPKGRVNVMINIHIAEANVHRDKCRRHSWRRSVVSAAPATPEFTDFVVCLNWELIFLPYRRYLYDWTMKKHATAPWFRWRWRWRWTEYKSKSVSHLKYHHWHRTHDRKNLWINFKAKEDGHWCIEC